MARLGEARLPAAPHGHHGRVALHHGADAGQRRHAGFASGGRRRSRRAAPRAAHRHHGQHVLCHAPQYPDAHHPQGRRAHQRHPVGRRGLGGRPHPARARPGRPSWPRSRRPWTVCRWSWPGPTSPEVPGALESPPEGALYDAIREVMAEHAPDGIVVPFLVTGGTDAKHLAPAGVRVYGFWPDAGGPQRPVHGAGPQPQRAHLGSEPELRARRCSTTSSSDSARPRRQTPARRYRGRRQGERR